MNERLSEAKAEPEKTFTSQLKIFDISVQPSNPDRPLRSRVASYHVCMRANAIVSLDNKPRFNPGLPISPFQPSTPQNVTDHNGITWTGPVVTGRIDLKFAHYQNALTAARPQPYAGRPLNSDPVLDAHIPSRSND